MDQPKHPSCDQRENTSSNKTADVSQGPQSFAVKILENIDTEAARILRPIVTEAMRRAPSLRIENAPLDDATNSSIFRAIYRGNVCFVPGATWRIFDSDHGLWITDRDKSLIKRLSVGVGLLRRESVNLSENPKEASKFAIYSLSAYGVKCTLDLAASEPALIYERNKFDRDPDSILDASGQHINLRTAETRKATAEDLFTRSLGASYSPVETCPRFDSFILQAMEGDIEAVSFLQRWTGYCLTGKTSEQKMMINVGLGANGKGTFSHVIETIMGDYAQSADSELFAPTRTRNPEYQLARLSGVRAVFVRETKDGAFLDEGIVKSLTGQDTIVARNPYEQQFQFVPEFKAQIETNNAPRVKGRNHAIWRRLIRVPWNHIVSDSEKDPGLGEKLKAESSGILRWMIDGAGDWYAEMLGLPQKIATATMMYQEETDILRDFLDGFLQEPDATAPSGELFTQYRQWAQASGVKPMSAPRFKEAMIERGYEWRRTNHSKFFKGICLVQANI